MELLRSRRKAVIVALCNADWRHHTDAGIKSNTKSRSGRDIACKTPTQEGAARSIEIADGIERNIRRS